MRTIDKKGGISYLAEAVRTAASNISNNSLRSFLTTVIVALGVTCLVGSQTAIDCLSSLLAGAFGTSAERITITSSRESSGGGSRKSKPISYQDAELFAENFPGQSCAIYTYVPPLTGVGCSGGRLAPQTTILAFEGDYLACNGLSVGEGRRWNDSRTVRTATAECVVGKKVAAQICRKTGTASAVGELVNVGGRSLRIAGVLASQSSLLGVLNDNTVYIPLQTAMGSLVSGRQGFSIDLTIPKESSEVDVRRARETMCRIRHIGSGEKPDFEIVEGSAAEREIGKLGGSLSGIALIIGLLTLLGAAVALTNIMLICAAERTREVGIRRAVGATRGDIRAGFIAEALLICEAGCLVGTLLGIAIGNALGIFLHTGIGIPWDWIAIAQAISLATGIAACTLPARRASRINVVEALRCE